MTTSGDISVLPDGVLPLFSLLVLNFRNYFLTYHGSAVFLAEILITVKNDGNRLLVGAL